MKHQFIKLLVVFITLITSAADAQIGIGTTTPHASSILDMNSTTTGMLIPRMTTAQRDAIPSPAPGLMVYVTTTSSFSFYTGSAWTTIGGGGGGGSSSMIMDGDGNTYVDVANASNSDEIMMQAGGNEVIRINPSGQVGIGTSTPGSTLDVNGDIQATLFIDKVNPQYYLYPSTTSVALNLAGSARATQFSDASNAAYYLDPASTGISLKAAGNTYAQIYFDESGTDYYLDPSNGSTSLRLAGSADATAFRDRNNTAYLLDPFSTSTLNNLTLNTTVAGPTAGFKIRTSNQQQYWTINSIEGDQDLGFYFDGAQKAYLNWDVNVLDIDFTASHRTLPAEGLLEDYKDLTGYIVVSSGSIVNLDGSNTPSISESLPTVQLSDQPNDKRIYGVISGVEDKADNKTHREYQQGAFVSVVARADAEDYRIIINASGEGGIWVSDINGAIENGDYITTSAIPGIGMKQSDDLLHNYTVAKVVMDCNFNLDAKNYQCKEVIHDGKTYRMAFLACVYQL